MRERDMVVFVGMYGGACLLFFVRYPVTKVYISDSRNSGFAVRAAGSLYVGKCRQAGRHGIIGRSSRGLSRGRKSTSRVRRPRLIIVHHLFFPVIYQFMSTLAKELLQEFIDRKEWASLRKRLRHVPAPELVDFLRQAGKQERIFVFRSLPKEHSAIVFAGLDPEEQD
ncbi:MAG: hypothetical protein GF344_14840, partial [Chitinivibrionales bacterium]|nr:hypothetical protein [Chitinivibrionales bacterium]